ncbi:nitroreductase family protein [Nonomuraea sediminis]|uniref:nitroreductase family protein n=1 Tax=Nonomuraea sediminis TaxID=2835864 RepID=UPI001BDCB8F7|nr:nitroreductase family protein [Nonomuraea sediminis]
MNGPHEPATRLIAAFREPAAARPGPARPRPAPEPLGPATIAPESGTPRADLLTTLIRRRSERFYAPGPIHTGLLADIVTAGIREDAAAWPGEQPLQTDVVAFDVDGLEPAMYRFEADRRSFQPVAPLPPPEEREHLTLQAEFCRSPAIVSIAADLAEADRARGAHGYRMLLGRISAAAYTMWLDAVASGLAGTVFAGFIPASVRRALHSDGTSRHHVFALAVGRAVPAHREE